MREFLVFVEGETEQLAFKRTFGFSPEIIGIASDQIAPERIAKFVAARVIRRGGCRKLFVLFDRETRAVESSDIETTTCDGLRRELDSAGLLGEVFVSVCDRVFESWLFSDTDELSKYFKRQISDRHVFEGHNGVELLKRVIGSGKYNKTYDGPRIFERVRWSVVRKKSSSARRSEIAGVIPDCEWLKR